MTGPQTPPPLPRARRRRKNPLPTILAVSALLGLTGIIAFGNLSKSVEYFKTPTEYAQEQASLQGRSLRLGGLVRDVDYNPQTQNLSFTITDGGASFPVHYVGGVSDLFRENQGVIVRGRFEGETFAATELIVKHSEKYEVPQTQSALKDMLRSSEVVSE
ncbi:cytochrome c maturation protein CcmE [Deinococcus lacus]|uniref:Cytochrome c-type biogenesis protein CcmE n=1 Tax=Deinococcus lacus TaxID=392561 RepID=A0ABW1YBY7_9DEIO